MTRAVSPPLLLVITLALLAGHTLFSSGLHATHDGILNLHRVFELEKCHADGQLPCRWAPDMGAGFGAPLFNFYPPLPSLVTLPFRSLGFDLVTSVNLAMALSLVVAAIGMFALARPLLGDWGAATASALYTWAPYHALDVFIRGALAEAWGLAWLPFVFWAARGILTSPRAWPASAACALAWCALLTTHNLVALMVAPFYGIWCLLLVAQSRRRAELRARLVPFAAAHLGAVALAAWYLGPSLLEQRYVHLETLTSLHPWNRYENNFLSVEQLLLGTRPWGPGGFHAPHGMSIFVGSLHWLLATLAGLIGGVLLLLRRRPSWPVGVVGFFIGTGASASLLATALSRPIWQAVPDLAILQFPWRFLGIATFGFSLAGGSVVTALGREGRGWRPPAAALVIAALLVTVGWRYFQPPIELAVQSYELVNEREIARTRHGLFDFMPVEVEIAAFPKEPPERPPESVVPLGDGGVRIERVRSASSWIEFSASVSGDAGMARINRFRFPGWALTVDGEQRDFAAVVDPLARQHVELEAGRHDVRSEFRDTAVRAWSDRVSLAAWAGLASWALTSGGRRLLPGTRVRINPRSA